MTNCGTMLKDFRTPRGTGTLGMTLFLISLGILFAASMVGYLIIRLTSDAGPPRGTLRLPLGLWISTAIILASSVTIHHALRNVRLDRQRAFRLAMLVTVLLGFAFLFVQGPNLYRLLQVHVSVRLQNIHLYGLVLLLIALHAAHVIGGLIALTLATGKAFKGRYDAASYEGVKYCVMYWHFLDVVWVVMFAGMSLAG